MVPRIFTVSVFRCLSWICFLLAVDGTAGEVFQWKRSEQMLGLAATNRLVWQFNFATNEAKPYFHPLSLPDGTVITAAHPKDHPWHRGVWFSWKYINHVNYWEEDKAGKSEGQTDVKNVNITTKLDFSARIEMDLTYHPRGKALVLTEKRVLLISAPDEAGNYSIDQISQFFAATEELQFDRTPPTNGSGGYGGFSVRLAPGMKSWSFTNSEEIGGAAANYGKKARWLDFSGPEGGITVFDHPENPRSPSPWYPNQSMPWFTPAFLFQEPYTLGAGKKLTLRYRVLVHSEAFNRELLDKEWADFTSDRQSP